MKECKTLAMVMALIRVSSAFGWVVSYFTYTDETTNFMMSISE